MRITRRLFLLFAASLASLRFPSRAFAQTLRTNITFILVNDIYLMADQEMPDGERRGGFARLAAGVKAERAKGGHVIFAHGGDTLSPSLMSGFDRGEHIITLTNMIPPDVFAVGNHEFDFGKSVFLERMQEAAFPVYAANLRGPDGQPLPRFKDDAILTFDSVRIGLTGLAYDKSAEVSSPGDLEFMPTVETAQRQAELMRREGADFVVAVMHAERSASYALWATRAVDLILTGHTHDLFVEFDGRNGIVESSHDAHYVTMIDVVITVTERRGKREVAWWPKFRVLDTATVEPDPEVAAAVARFEAEFTKEMDVPIGVTAVELDSRSVTVRTGEAAIGDLIADALRAANQADVAILNGGAVRADKVYRPGTEITRRDILSELPFGNRVVTMQVSGTILKDALENGLSLLPEPAGRFPQVSGMQVEYDPRRPAGSRVLSVEVGNAPLDHAKFYRIATIDFVAGGGDGYVMLRNARRITPDADAPLLANEVMTYIRRLGTIRTTVAERLVKK